MRGYTELDWLEEIKKSLKEGVPAEFKKTIFNGHTISPFSALAAESAFQATVPSRGSFLAIQNYAELKKAGMDQWIADPDVGFRFREFEDLKAVAPQFSRPVSTYLSQPFAFALSEDQGAFLNDFSQAGSEVNLGWSPLSFGLTRGEILKKPFHGWENIFSHESLHHENVEWFYLSSAPYQWAGCEPHMELAIMMSLGFSVLQELESFQITPAQAAKKLSFGLSLGTDILVESSKVTAMKLLWARLTEMMGAPECNPHVYALPSLRVFSGRDPWNNIVRMSLMSFAGMVGGARGFKCIPYDVLNKRKTSDAIRVSTNIPLLLKKEGYLNLVLNPLDGGSLFQDSISGLCEGAWTVFQEIERKGGIFEAVRSGWLQMEMRRAADYSKNEMSYLQKELVGVNKFTSKQAPYGEEGDLIKLGDIIDPLFLTHSADDYLPVEPLVVSALSYEWESLQVSSDRFFYKNGARPKVLVVKGGGPVAEKKSTWLHGVLALGGVETETVAADQISDVTKWTSLTIIISSGDEMDQTLSQFIKAKGVEKLWSLSHARKESLVDRYVETNVNALEFVKDVHHLVGSAQ